MSDKKKRRIKVRSLGAGDPTLYIELELESKTSDPPSTPIGFHVETVDPGPVVALDENFDIAFDTNVKILSSFTGSETLPDPMPTTLSMLSLYYIFNFENLTSNPVTGTTDESISFGNITHIAPPNITLGSNADIAMQLRGTTSNNVMLQAQGNTLSVTKTLINTVANHHWKVNQYPGTTDKYSLSNAETGKFLVPNAAAPNGLGWSNTKPNQSNAWTITKADPTMDEYTLQNSAGDYLSSTGGYIHISTVDTKWFLHIDTIYS